MKAQRMAWRLALVLASCVALLSSVGCTYLQHRGEDFLEMVDVGFTVSEKPGIGLYWNSLDIFPVGYSNVDGHFVGWGGGQIGVTRHYNKCWGLGYGYEEIGWGDLAIGDEETVDIRGAGILGILGPPYSGPDYTPACVHFFPHLGYVGLVWNARYTEILDFVLGWTTIDIAGDDGYKIGRWAFPRRE